MDEDDWRAGSAPCFAHLLVDGRAVDPDTARDVSRFRRAERVRLIAARKALSVQDRFAMTERLAASLGDLLLCGPRLTVAVYWPIRGEPDLRSWMTAAHHAGAAILLPVVVEKDAPVVFRRWTPGCAMQRGIWNIPAPVEGEPERPDVVVAPLVGVDEQLFRLGNGGGYYDRTLARLDPPPHAVGVGFSFCHIPTIYPMPWDIPMQSVVLADGKVRSRA
jgi:5-formyltetrahydrofolate cyclo-ligase